MEINGKVNLTKEVEDSEEFKESLAKKGYNVKAFEKWRELNPNVKLDNYKVKIK